MVDWVMNSHKVSFRHACELLLAGAGGPKKISQGKLRQAQSFAVPAADAAAEAAADQVLLDQVLDFYHETLKASPEALAYLDRRGWGKWS